MGDVQKAKEVFEKLLTGEDHDKARGHRHLALLNMFQGKFSDAISHLKESVILNNTLNNTLSELRDRLYLTTAYRSLGMMDSLNEELNTINEIREKSYIGPWWLQVAGKKIARMGKIADADSLLGELSRKMNDKSNNDRAAFNILKGEIELGRGNYSEGLKIIEVASKLRGDIYVLESLAFAYFANADLEKAIVTYENLLSLQDMPFGWEGQEYWILAHYQLGKIYEQQGNTAKAIENYEKFLDLWKDADPGIAEVEDARERLSSLKNQ
jgi:tetratricopeptide (TPR) repeat protein